MIKAWVKELEELSRQLSVCSSFMNSNSEYDEWDIAEIEEAMFESDRIIQDLQNDNSQDADITYNRFLNFKERCTTLLHSFTSLFNDKKEG